MLLRARFVTLTLLLSLALSIQMWIFGPAAVADAAQIIIVSCPTILDSLHKDWQATQDLLARYCSPSKGGWRWSRELLNSKQPYRCRRRRQRTGLNPPLNLDQSSTHRCELKWRHPQQLYLSPIFKREHPANKWFGACLTQTTH